MCIKLNDCLEIEIGDMFQISRTLIRIFTLHNMHKLRLK